MTTTFKGLVYVKHGRVGTRSEGPDYILQTARQELVLVYKDRHLWEPDYQLEFYSRRMVEVQGMLDGQTLKVESIQQILSPMLPTG
ncbi:MAG: hypothetical protein U0359_27640 [Byssovorax sp.]